MFCNGNKVSLILFTATCVTGRNYRFAQWCQSAAWREWRSCGWSSPRISNYFKSKIVHPNSHVCFSQNLNVLSSQKCALSLQEISGILEYFCFNIFKWKICSHLLTCSFVLLIIVFSQIDPSLGGGSEVTFADSLSTSRGLEGQPMTWVLLIVKKKTFIKMYWDSLAIKAWGRLQCQSTVTFIL